MNAKLIIVALVAIVAVAAAGIFVVLNSEDSNNGPELDDKGKVKEISCEPYTITDANGQKYTYDHTLGPVAVNWSYMGGAFFTMAALVGEDLPKYLVAMDVQRMLKADYAFVMDQMPELKNLVDVYPTTSTDASAIISSKPSAYIDYLPSLANNETSGGLKERLSEAGIPIFYVNFHSEDPYIIADSIRMIGAIFGLNDKAEQLAQQYLDHTVSIFAKTNALIAANGGVRPLVCAERGAAVEEIGTSWNNTVQWGAMIYRLGGSNMIPEGANYPQLTHSSILDANPKLYLISSQRVLGDGYIQLGFHVPLKETLKQVENLFNSRTGYSDLDCWTSEPKHVYIVNYQVGRNVFGYAGVEFLAQIIWPNEYADLTPVEDFEKFWKDWLPFKLEGQYMIDYGAEMAKIKNTGTQMLELSSLDAKMAARIDVEA